MTFCGDLPFVPSGINHHLFENLRRKGHHCHGRKRLSGGRPQKFLPASGQKLLRDVHFTPGLAETVVAVCAPGDRDSYGCVAPDTTTGRNPPQRREARFAKRRCPLHPGGLLPGCRERRPRRDRGGATGTVAASQGFASGMEARQGGDSFAGSVHDSPPRQGDARKRHKQENNKTDSNQSSRKKKNSSSSSSSSSSRNNNIISNRQMTGLKRQKPTAERPRNERGGA